MHCFAGRREGFSDGYFRSAVQHLSSGDGTHARPALWSQWLVCTGAQCDGLQRRLCISRCSSLPLDLPELPGSISQCCKGVRLGLQFPHLMFCCDFHISCLVAVLIFHILCSVAIPISYVLLPQKLGLKTHCNHCSPGVYYLRGGLELSTVSCALTNHAGE